MQLVVLLCWESSAPIAYPDVLTSSLKGASWSGCASTGSNVTRFFSVLKAWSSSVVHHHGVFLCVSLLRGHV